MAENGRYRAVKEKYALRQRSGIYTRYTRGFIEKTRCNLLLVYADVI